MNFYMKIKIYLYRIVYFSFSEIFTNQPLSKKDIQNYSDYIDHQKIKSSDLQNINNWTKKDYYSQKTKAFKKLFDNYSKFINNKKCLSVGSRVGNEVLALQYFTSDVIGIDIVPYKDLVIKGDMHKMNFPDKNFDFIFTNIIDHSIDPEKFFSECHRVLKPNGALLVHCSFANDEDEYTVFNLRNKKQAKKLGFNFSEIKIKFSKFTYMYYWDFEREILYIK